MRPRTATALWVGLLGLMLPPGHGAQSAQAQSVVAPRAYSFTLLGSPLMGPDATFKVYRDGDREAIETTFPVSAERPNGYRDRRVYDFQAHKVYLWSLDDPGQPCGPQSIGDHDVPEMMDIITGFVPFTDQIAKQNLKVVRSEIVNGIATRAMEARDPAGQQTVRVWLAEKGGYVIKMVTVPKGGAPQTNLEVKGLRFDKPQALEFVLPARCNASANTASPANKAPVTAGGGPLPKEFAAPPGFEVSDKKSRQYDFNHEPMAYLKGGSMQHIEPEGRTWTIFMNVTPPNKTNGATDASMRAALKTQGWDIYTPSGTLIAHRMKLQSVVYSHGKYREPGYEGTGKAFMAIARPYYKIVADPDDTSATFREGYDGSAWEWYRSPGIVVRTM